MITSQFRLGVCACVHVCMCVDGDDDVGTGEGERGHEDAEGTHACERVCL